MTGKPSRPRFTPNAIAPNVIANRLRVVRNLSDARLRQGRWKSPPNDRYSHQRPDSSAALGMTFQGGRLAQGFPAGAAAWKHSQIAARLSLRCAPENPLSLTRERVRVRVSAGAQTTPAGRDDRKAFAPPIHSERHRPNVIANRLRVVRNSSSADASSAGGSANDRHS